MIEILNDPAVREVLTGAFIQVCAVVVAVSLVVGVGSVAMDQRARRRGTR